ncbi:MAG: tetratricopeptide repeat protein [Niabella sp.]|nr:tetratricopeptide repeat protein [Niabella sp.]
MKRFILTYLIVLLMTAAYAQKMPQDYFNEAVQWEEAGKPDAAIANYHYIIKHHPRNKIYVNALYNLGNAFAAKKEYRQAIAAYEKVVNSGYDDKTLVGGDIMASPLGNLKHYASMGIYEAYDSLKQYDSALVYLNQANNVNSYEHFCGNAQASKDIYMSLRYADLFENLKDSTSSEKALLQTIFHESEGNTEVIQRLISLYKYRGYKQLALEFDKAVDLLKEEADSRYPAMKNYSIIFRKTEIKIPDLFYMSADEPDRAAIQAKLKECYFRGIQESL